MMSLYPVHHIRFQLCLNCNVLLIASVYNVLLSMHVKHMYLIMTCQDLSLIPTVLCHFSFIHRCNAALIRSRFKSMDATRPCDLKLPVSLLLHDISNTSFGESLEEQTVGALCSQAVEFCHNHEVD